MPSHPEKINTLFTQENQRTENKNGTITLEVRRQPCSKAKMPEASTKVAREYDADVQEGVGLSGLSGLSGTFVGQGSGLIDLQMHAQTLALSQLITQSSKGVRSF
jgi:hypothetical protein